jgi:hypothetical protein
MFSLKELSYVYVKIGKNTLWASVWAIFSQKHLVALLMFDEPFSAAEKNKRKNYRFSSLGKHKNTFYK